MCGDRFKGEPTELVVATVNKLKQCAAHSRVPKFPQVCRQVQLRLVAIGHGLEKNSNLVDHADEGIVIHFFL